MVQPLPAAEPRPQLPEGSDVQVDLALRPVLRGGPSPTVSPESPDRNPMGHVCLCVSVQVASPHVSRHQGDCSVWH